VFVRQVLFLIYEHRAEHMIRSRPTDQPDDAGSHHDIVLFDDSNARMLISKSRTAYWKWVTSQEGGIFWMENMLRVYQDARRDGNAEQLLNTLLNRRTEGQAILAGLRKAIACPLPEEEWEICDLWMQSIELTASLQEGLLAIEAAIVLHRISDIVN
jgi:hypothetical protein